MARSAAALSFSTLAFLAPASIARPAGEDDSIHPFTVRVPQAELNDLRRRLAATRWPDKETVADQSQGAQLVMLQDLIRYWCTQYNWRNGEAKLNAFPQFKTRIDGTNIHFIHVKSRHPNALPLILTHGWPGSVFEQIKLIGPLTDPTRYAAGRKMPSMSSFRPCRASASPSDRPKQAGDWSASAARGASS